MANTTNLVMPLVDAAQSSKEATIDAALQILDDVAFVRKGTLAARPAASRAGRLYWATDAGNEGLYRDTGSAWESFLQQHLSLKGGSAPSAAAGANAGTSPPAPVVAAGSNDQRGLITWGTGTGPSAGAQVAVTFAAAYGAAPYVLFTTTGGITQNLGVFLFASSTTGFTIGSAGIPAASQGNGVYSINYLAVA